MNKSSPPDTLPKYLSEGLPKQDTDTLKKTREYLNTLIEHREQPVKPDEVPGKPADDPDQSKAGVVVEEYIKCGDDNCECSSGEQDDKHGPYLYRYYREDGKLKSEYEGKA